MPAKGEKLQIGDIGQLTDDARVQKALKRLAADKAPETVAQLVMWRVAGEARLGRIAEMSRKWSQRPRVDPGPDFVDQLDTLPEGESGALLCEITRGDPALEAVAGRAEGGPQGPVRPRPAGQLGRAGAARRAGGGLQGPDHRDGREARGAGSGRHQRRRADVGAGRQVHPAGDREKDGKVKAEAFADALAEGILGRLVRAQLSKAGGSTATRSTRSGSIMPRP